MDATTPPPVPPAPTGTGDRLDERGAQFFDQVRRTRLVRPDDRRWGAGVAVAIADRLQVDPLLIRGLFVAASILGGAGLLAYGVGWALIPQPDGRIHAQRVLSGDVTAGTVGAGLAVLFGLGGNVGPFDGGWNGWFNPGGLIVLGLVAAGLWWWFGKRGGPSPRPNVTPSTDAAVAPAPEYGTPPAGHPGYGWSASAGEPAPPVPAPVPVPVPRPKPGPDPQAPVHLLTRATLGIALLAAVATAALGIGSWWVPATVALGVIALGVITAGVLGRRSGGLAPIGVVLALVVAAGAVLPAPPDPGTAGSAAATRPGRRATSAPCRQASTRAPATSRST